MNRLICSIMNNGKNYGDKVAVVDGGSQISYGKLWDKVRKIGGLLMTLGIKAEEPVLLESQPNIAYVEVFLALKMIGAVTVPVERGIRSEQLSEQAELTGAKICILRKAVSMEKQRIIYTYENILLGSESWSYESEATLVQDEAISEMILTTGTTGKPKITVHTCGGIDANTTNTIEGLALSADARVLLPLPLNHSFGLRIMRSVLEVGATLILQNGAIFSGEIAKAIQKHDCTGIACVSATIENMLRELGDVETKKCLEQLSFIEVSAGAMPKNIRETLIRLLPEVHIYNTWGSSESGGCLFLDLHANPKKIDSVGKPGKLVECAIYLDELKSFAKGTGSQTVGRLAIRGPMVMKEYWNQIKLTGETIKDGWLITGDLVWRDEDDYYYMLGRADYMINIGGEKVAPKEIEEAAQAVDGIVDCACIPVTDENGILGQVPLLYYVSHREINTNQIKREIASKIGGYKAPVKYVRVDCIPRNKMEKIDYKALKRMSSNPIKERNVNLHNETIRSILGRRSLRKFSEDPVEHRIVETLISLGQSAPSGKNLQTRQFYVIESRSEIEALKELLQKVSSRTKTSFNGFENPPLLILVTNDRRNKDGIQDVGCSVENILVGAHSLGLGGVWLNPLMEICDEEEIRKKLNTYGIPESHIVWACVAIGWPAEEAPVFVRKENKVRYIGEAHG